MNNAKKDTPGVRELLVRAGQAAAGKDSEKALALFDECTREYLRRGLPFRAIAVAGKARTVLGPTPKVSALIIRTYRAVGLEGDARKEIEAAAASLRAEGQSFFAALDEDAFLDLLAVMDVVHYTRGKTVLKRFDAGGDVFVILLGTCEVLKNGKRLSVLGPGDIFGEIGFFSRAVRTATVKTCGDCVLARIPPEPLRVLKERHLCLRQILESVYSERIMKKLSEDLGEMEPAVAVSEVIATLRYAKGQDIPVHPDGSVAVLKHGVVEVDYDDMCLKTKRYLKPGSIISRKRQRARASTDVVIMLNRIQGGPQKGPGMP